METGPGPGLGRLAPALALAPVLTGRLPVVLTELPVVLARPGTFKFGLTGKFGGPGR
jgi:hypothetical protein